MCTSDGSRLLSTGQGSVRLVEVDTAQTVSSPETSALRIILHSVPADIQPTQLQPPRGAVSGLVVDPWRVHVKEFPIP